MQAHSVLYVQPVFQSVQPLPVALFAAPPASSFSLRGGNRYPQPELEDKAKFETFVRGNSWKPWRQVVDQHVMCLPRTEEAFRDIILDPCIDYVLSRGRSAGQQLKHCTDWIDRVLTRISPCIFKIGLTHDAALRWNNTCYGYSRDSHKWSCMVVIWAGASGLAAAYVEAALIMKYQGILIEVEIGGFVKRI